MAEESIIKNSRVTVKLTCHFHFLYSEDLLMLGELVSDPIC